MAAAAQNRYAEKWTRERTLRALEYIKSFTNEPDCIYLGSALSRAGYYEDVWRYWRKKWARDHDITYMMKMLMQTFEAKIVERVSNSKMPVRFAMFALSHHYGWGRENKEDDLSYLAEEDRKAPLPTLSEGEGFNTPLPTFATANKSATADKFPEGEGSGPIQTLPEGQAGLSEGEGLHTELHEEDAEEEPEMEDEVYEVTTPDTYDRYEPGSYNQPRMTYAERDFYAHKVTCYNMEHADAPITELLGYYDGPVPEGKDGIAWDGGHFRRYDGGQ
ncbi:MAG: hypothetical protein JST83_13635 [Bacteroidetes bacterium]|nr:hypothetical protein [Bacteroidota bacterium]